MEPQVITLNENIPIHGLIDELTYRCYAYNRKRNPNITPESWAKVLPNVPAMEKRYQSEDVE